MKTFNELLVWQKAHRFVLEVYRMTRGFPAEERFGLISQMRRSSISVAANIAEGHQRQSKHEFLNFLNIAHGSLDELKYYLILARDLRYLSESTWQRCGDAADEIGKMLNGLRSHITSEVRDVKSKSSR